MDTRLGREGVAQRRKVELASFYGVIHAPCCGVIACARRDEFRKLTPTVVFGGCDLSYGSDMSVRQDKFKRGRMHGRVGASLVCE